MRRSRNAEDKMANVALDGACDVQDDINKGVRAMSGKDAMNS